MIMEPQYCYGWGTIADGWRKGPWTPQEDKILTEHVNLHGEGRWNCVSKLTGLRRSGKSCRLRWVNYLRPDLKRGKITPHEESIILELHARWGNRWSTIARSLPGRTDNEIKNYWRTHFKKGKSAKNVEQARARFLRHQQEQKQQHQLLLQDQLHYEPLLQQQQQQVTDMNSSCIMGSQVEVEAIAQDLQEMANYCMQPLFQFNLEDDNNGAISLSETEGSSDDCTWGAFGTLMTLVPMHHLTAKSS